MKIKGFVGYYSDSCFEDILACKENVLKETIFECEKYFSKNFTVFCSKEFVMESSPESLKIQSGKNSSKDSSKIAIKIEFSEKLNVVRDFWGVRTLYYNLFKKGILLSSDIRFLLPFLPSIEYDTQALQESSVLGFIYSVEKTLFKKIKQLPPNSKLEFEKEKLKILQNFHSLPEKFFPNFNDALEAFSETFERVVFNAMSVSDKNAFLLSGGMDSSALAIAATKKYDIETVSFVSSQNAEDAFYASNLAQKLGTQHHCIEFLENDAMLYLPEFIASIENVELEGIFSPLGGYAYYLLCRRISELGFKAVFPGEGADEILGGYYWPLTHTFGFVDRLKKKTWGTPVYAKVVSLFPEQEDRLSYRKVAFDFFKGSALTNYHLNCVEHSAKSFGITNYPVFMLRDIYEILSRLDINWLCDGKTTKILLRKYLEPKLKAINLENLAMRKKLAMPSVVTDNFKNELKTLSAVYSESGLSHPFSEFLGRNAQNCFMFDIFHKYFSERPLAFFDEKEWLADLKKIEDFNESIVHW